MNLKKGALLHNNTYRIERVLGQGGFGITYLAVHIRLKKKVAIKEFFPKAFCDRDADTSHVRTASKANSVTVEKLKNKFIKEAEHIAEMDSPYIVRIIDVFEENHTAYYIMDYIEGRSLSDIVKSNGPLPVDQAVEYVTKIGEALTYIHSKRMNHLDVKPANIMVRSKDNIPILIDFGLSKQYDSDGNQTSTTPVGISHGYAPIEQYHDGGVREFSPQTDLYSLAATLYSLLSGKVPPQASALVENDLTFPSSFPQNLEDPIRKAMSSARKRRQESISEFIKEIGIDISNTIKKMSEKYGDEHSIKYLKISSQSAENCLYNNSYDYQLKEKVPHESLIKTKSKLLIYTSAIFALIIVGYLLLGSHKEENSSVANNTQMKIESTPSELTEKAHILLKQRNYQEAIPLFLEAAEQGNPRAQYWLGEIYQRGWGVDQNFREAMKWYALSAEQGFKEAQFGLGEMNSGGEDIPQNDAEALKWYNKATDQGFAKAQDKLGWIYFYGKHGIQKNTSEGLMWYKKAAEQGYSEAQETLGSIYRYGFEGVKKDYNEAIKWYTKAAERGHFWAPVYLGEIYFDGPTGIRNKQKAKEWWSKAAKNGNEVAKKNLEEYF